MGGWRGLRLGESRKMELELWERVGERGGREVGGGRGGEKDAC